MQKPVQIYPEQYHPVTETVGRLPPGVRYRMAHAKGKGWIGKGFWLAEQYHNGRHAFASVVEAQCSRTIHIAVQCVVGDVVWAYLLEGNVRAVATDCGPAQTTLQLSQGRYQPFYAAAGRYRLTFDPGRCLLFYFVVQLDWLRRYGGAELAAIAPLLQGVRVGYALGQTMPLRFRHRRLLLHLWYLDQHHLTLAQDVALYRLLADLIYHYIDELADHAAHKETMGEARATEIQTFLDREILRGNIPSLGELCAGFGISEKGLYNLFTTELGEAPGQYIHRIRMEEAHRLLSVEGWKPTAVAYQLGYDHLRTFGRAFKRHFGKTPSEV